jgi:hypothetical protein
MPMNYEQFGVRIVRVEVYMWPGFEHPFREGELSALYGKLNRDDTFDSCDLSKTLSARFDSEHWRFDINRRRILIRTEQFGDAADLCRRLEFLLSETRAFFREERPRQQPLQILAAPEVYASTTLPEAKGDNVAAYVRKKLLKPMSNAPALPGLHGAGVRFVGDTEEFHWHMYLDPSHGRYSNLNLSVELFFSPVPDEGEAEEGETDLDIISKRLTTSYNFLADTAKEFAQAVLP